MSDIILKGDHESLNALVGAIDSTVASLQHLAANLRNALPGAPPASKWRDVPTTNDAKAAKPRSSSSTLLTRTEMADLLACDTRTLRRWELTGDVPKAIHVGGAKRWRRGEVMAWLEAKRK